MIKMMVISIEGLQEEAFTFHTRMSGMAAFCVKHCPLWGQM